MQTPLTPQQQKFFSWIEGFIADHSMAPTYREIQSGLGYGSSLSPVRNHLKTLQAAGYLSYVPGKARSIQILRPSRQVPILGTIAAHSLMTAFSDQEMQWIDCRLPKLACLSPHEFQQHFALQVCGDSMIKALIADGDVVVLRRGVEVDEIKDKTIVAARVNDATTLKYFYRNGSLITLKPANPRYKATTINAAVEDFEVQGIYVGVLRDLV